jgi:hypothetical protein
LVIASILNVALRQSHRLLPWKLPEKGVPSYLYGVLELNGLWEERSEFAGGDVVQSGG